MKGIASKSRLVWFTLGGVVLGYLLMHPFAMLAYLLGPRPQAPLDLSLWGRQMHLAFDPEMLAMGAAFAFMGGVSGLCLGAWYLLRERWVAERVESEKRLAALDTLQELMVTLAHHIRNANVVIGGFSARMLKNTADQEMQQRLKLMQLASQEIEAVIASLESLSKIDRTPYISAWETKMIDLSQELKARLQAAATLRKPHEP